MATTTAAAQPRRVRKRIWIPSVLLAALVLVGGWLWWRGSFADSGQRNPKTVAEGSVTQLVTQDGGTFVRTAVIVDASPKAVWQVVTDYDSHPRFMPYIAEITSTKKPEGKTHIIGLAHSRLWGDWPFDIDIKHHENAEKGEYSAAWNEENKSGFTISRGSWTVQRLGDNQTLLAFAKEMEVPGYPNFLVRNILMDRVGAIVRSVRDEVGKRGLK